jgi:hypothetical protein
VHTAAVQYGSSTAFSTIIGGLRTYRFRGNAGFVALGYARGRTIPTNSNSKLKNWVVSPPDQSDEATHPVDVEWDDVRRVFVVVDEDGREIGEIAQQID